MRNYFESEFFVFRQTLNQTLYNVSDFEIKVAMLRQILEQVFFNTAVLNQVFLGRVRFRYENFEDVGFSTVGIPENYLFNQTFYSQNHVSNLFTR